MTATLKFGMLRGSCLCCLQPALVGTPSARALSLFGTLWAPVCAASSRYWLGIGEGCSTSAHSTRVDKWQSEEGVHDW